MEIFNASSKQNTIVFGKQSLKKYDNIILPYLFKAMENDESFVVTDPEDILMRRIGTELQQKNYSIISINLRNPDNSNSWNPLFAAYEAYKAGDIDLCIERLNSIATIIMSDNSIANGSDPFWDFSAIDLFVGLSLILFKEATEESQINMGSIYYMAQKGFSRFGASTIIDTYFTDVSNSFYIARNALSSILSAPTDTRGSILSVFYQKIRAFTIKDKFLNKLCVNDLSVNSLIAPKMAIFICYEDEHSASVALVKIFLRQLVDTLIKTRDVLNSTEKTYHFVFSNFLSLGVFPEIDRFISSCNSRNINMLLDIYSINEFYKLYGKETSSFVFGYCASWYILAAREVEMQLMINRFLKISGKSPTQNKSLFDLAPDEVMILEDSNNVRIQKIEKTYSYDKLYSFQHEDISNNISLLKFDELVKEKKRETIFNSGVHQPLASAPSENNLKVDDLLSAIDRKIAQLEINEKLDKATRRGQKDI